MSVRMQKKKTKVKEKREAKGTMAAALKREASGTFYSPENCK